MAEPTLIQNFTEGNILKQLARFSWPLFLANFLQMIYNVADMVIAGNVMGEVGLSAVTVGGDVVAFLTFVAMGFANAGQIIVAQYIGAGRREKIGCMLGTMACFFGIFSIGLALAGFVFRIPVLHWLNAPAEVWSNAMAYYTVCLTGLPLIFGYNAVSALLRGMGNSRYPLLFVAISILLNIALDCLFMIAWRMGTFGAALATVISQFVSFLCAVRILIRCRDRCGFVITRKEMRFHSEAFTALMKLGIPMAIKNASVHFSMLFVRSQINAYGIIVSAVTGIGSKLNSVSNLSSNAMSTAGASMIAQNIEAGKYKRVARIMTMAFLVAACFCALLCAAILLFPQNVFKIFTGDMSIMGIALEYVPVAVLAFAGSAFRAPAQALINGCGNYKINFMVAILDGIVMRIGFAMLLGCAFNMGYPGLWLGDAVAGFTPFVIGAVYYISGLWRKGKDSLSDAE